MPNATNAKVNHKQSSTPDYLEGREKRRNTKDEREKNGNKDRKRERNAGGEGKRYVLLSTGSITTNKVV